MDWRLGNWISNEVTFMFSKIYLNARVCVILNFRNHISCIVMAMVIDAFTSVSSEIILINIKYVDLVTGIVRK